jgi:ACS family D-galactonate transporter-like MFS transporter
MNAPAAPSDETLLVRATWVRWRIVALLLALSFLSWFLRKSMPVAYTERIQVQYHITPEAMGGVYSVFLFVYAACMTPGGWVIDRFGTRTALLIMGVGPAVFWP